MHRFLPRFSVAFAHFIAGFFLLIAQPTTFAADPVFAKLKVESSLEAIPLGKCIPPWVEWKNIPDFLKDATIYEKAEKTTGNKIQFEALSDGMVVIAASWNYDGNKGGNWHEDRSTDKILVENGWVAIGQMNRMTNQDKADPHMLYRRTVKTGETFKFHTRKYNPPMVIIPAEKYIKEVAAARMPEITPVAVAPSKPALATANPQNDKTSPGENKPSATFAKTIGPSPSLKNKAWIEFTDVIEPGAMLTGLKLTMNSTDLQRRISSIQPVYETSKGRVYGKVHGLALGSTLEVEAKPGYVIAGLTVSQGEVVAGLRVTFMRRNEAGLDAEDKYDSRWIGDQTGENELLINTKGKIASGISGRVGEAIRSLDLIYDKP